MLWSFKKRVRFGVVEYGPSSKVKYILETESELSNTDRTESPSLIFDESPIDFGDEWFSGLLQPYKAKKHKITTSKQ